MVRKEELTYKSRDRQTMLNAVRWIPEGQPIAILQVIHGMQEYTDRYDEYARFMAENGIMVIGNDNLGHGKSVNPPSGAYGYFCKNDPATVLVRDAHRLKKMAQEEFPGVPVFILGHSFGSFIAREYTIRNRNKGSHNSGNSLYDKRDTRCYEFLGRSSSVLFR